MIDDINTKRTELANQMAAAGAAALDFNATAAVLAAIPDTEPQQYVAAGTPENIAAILPATICPQRRQKHGDRPTEALVFDEPAATSGDAPADLQQLKALALAATPGHWYTHPITDDDMYPRGLAIVAENGKTLSNEDTGPGDKDAQFIAAANPAVVLDLIARIERGTAPHAAQWNLTDARESLARAQAFSGFNDLPQPLRVEIDNAASILAKLDAAPHGRAAPTEAAPPVSGGEPDIFTLGASAEFTRKGGGYASVGEYVRIEDYRAAVSAATKPTACTLPPPGWHCTRAPGHEGPCAAVPTEVYADDYTPEQKVIYEHGVEDGKLIARGMERYKAGVAARDAATKPTADLSELNLWRPIYDGEMELDNACGRFVMLSDVQSLLATKPAAAQAVPEGFVIVPKVPTDEMRDAGNVIMLDRGKLFQVWRAMLAAAPAASTIGAAQTADQVRTSDLETVVKFLMGEAPLEGVEFGEKHPTKAGAYWWRLNLRAAWQGARK